jgi:3-dehydroquinate dehydratase-1
MSTIIFVGDKDCDLLVDLAAEILGSSVKHWEKHPEKIPNGRSFVWSITRQTFNSYCEEPSTSWNRCICISLRCIGKTYDHDIDISAIDYEYSFIRRKLVRGDFVRFLSFITGQSKPLDLICEKKRSYYIGMTFPNVNVSLPNLSIVSVGADALELRVDLLEDQDQDEGNGWNLPSIEFVAAQFMALRSSTELPIIFTVRSEKGGGRYVSKQYLMYI